MTTEGPDLDALERLAEQAINAPDSDGTGFARAMAWQRMNSALSPATVRTLIRWARLGQAWEAAQTTPGWHFTGLREHADGGWVAIAHLPYLPKARTESARSLVAVEALTDLVAKIRE